MTLGVSFSEPSQLLAAINTVLRDSGFPILSSTAENADLSQLLRVVNTAILSVGGSPILMGSAYSEPSQLLATIKAAMREIAEESTLFDLYVDSINGSDANNGQTPATALATIAALGTLLPNVSVGFARGSHWREKLQAVAAIYGVYGSGDRPILDASDIAPNDDFSLTVDQTFVYQIAWDHSIPNDGGKRKFSVWEDDLRLIRVADVATCESTAGSFYAPLPIAGATQTIYVHASDSSDVITNGKLYEITAREYAITVAASGEVSGLHGKRTAHNDGVISAGATTVLYDCVAEDGQIHNVFIGAGGLCDGVLADKIEVGTTSAGAATMFIAFGAAGLNATFRNCTARGGYPLEAWYAGSIGFYVHTQTGLAGTVTFENCTVENCSSGISGEAATLVIDECTTIDVKNAFGGSVSGTFTARQNFAGRYTDTAKRMINMFAVSSSGSNLDRIMEGNVGIANATVGGLITSGTGRSNTLNNNTFVGLGGQVSGYQGTLADITWDRNIFYNMNPIQQATNVNAAWISDNNVMYPATSDVQYKNVSYSSVALYQAGTGLDANTSTADPGFVNADPTTWETIADAAINGAAAVALQGGATYYQP